MAKRKRLSPVDPDHVTAEPPVLETKSAFPLGVARTRTLRPSGKAAPIADVAHETAATAALEEVTQTLSEARRNGRMIVELPLDAVDAGYLVRDRTRIDADEMTVLRNSIAARGQQTPIEVVALDGGRYGLISGWRRLTALRDLAAGAGEDGPATVLALLRRPDDSAQAYLAMLEENEIRVGLSYYERAHVAARAVQMGVFETEKQALLSLFAAASRAKRSKIRSFLVLVDALHDVLRFPEDIPERLGLQLAQALEADPSAPARFRAALQKAAASTAEAERACLQGLLKPPAPAPAPAPAQSPRPGLQVERAGPSRVILSGPSVDDRLYDRLLAFLAQPD